MTPTDEQVERMAKAVFADDRCGDNISWYNHTELVREAYRRSARVAIAAMQPTVAQAAEVLLTPDDKGNRTAVYSACEGNCKVYRFDAALRALTESSEGG